MCGRISFTLNKDEFIQILHDRYNIKDYDFDYDFPQYNIAPSKRIISIINDGINYRVGLLKWGFIPVWAKDEKFYSINAKAETISSKPMFKQAFKTQRCVILADGYYEWKKENKNKIPHRFTIKDQKVLPLAGLWNTFTKQDNKKVHTCTIITTTPNDSTKQIHDRMPVILTRENEKLWLDPKVKDEKLLTSLLIPYYNENMSFYKVSTIVNNPRNNDKNCIIPI